MRRPARIFLILPILLSLTAAAAVPDAALAERVQSWSAPLYWSNAVPHAEASAREALASGRQSLAPGPAALPFIALPPCRLVDTRGNGAPLQGGFLPAATVRNYTLTGVCGIPANAQAISLNATVVNPIGPGFLVLYPQGGTFPPVSTLNYLGSDVIVNAAVVPLSVSGGISVALGVSGGDVLLDTNGYYAPINSVPSFTGPLAGDVNGTQGATVVSTVGGSTAANVHAAELAANAATTSNAADTIVKRDASGNVSAGGYTQPGTGGETLRIVRGIIQGSDAAIISGSGFAAVRNSVGQYSITYSQGFSSLPTVTLTVLNFGGGTAVINAVGMFSFTIARYNPAGSLSDDSYIMFTVIGPP